MKIVIVTGSSGFIGGHIISRLLKEEKNTLVIALDKKEFDASILRYYASCKLNTKILGNKFIFKKTKINMGMFNVVKKIIDENNIGIKDNNISIYHCASPVGVNYHLKNDTLDESMIINHGVLNCLDKLNELGANTTLNFMSSSEVYGNISEHKKSFYKIKNRKIYKYNKYLKPNHFIGKRGQYVAQKLAAENLFLLKRDETKVNIFRLFNIVGVFQDPEKGIVAKLIKKLINDEEITINDTTTRTYTPVEVAVSNIFLAEKYNGGIYNICEPGNIYSPYELLTIIYKEFSKKGKKYNHTFGIEPVPEDEIKYRSIGTKFVQPSYNFRKNINEYISEAMDRGEV